MGSVGNKDEPKWPVKSREIQNHHLDSHVWNNFPFREDDIIIDTWAKAGTTWTQQIVGQLVFNGADDVNPHEVSPWLDMRHVPDEPTIAMLEAQKHRRFIKSHLPLDGLVYSPKAKYLFVARDARDTMWSMHNHFIKATPFFWQMVNDTPGRVGCAMKRPKEDPRDHFCDFLDTDSDEGAYALAVLAAYTRVLGSKAPAQSASGSLQRPEGGHGGRDPTHREIP